MDTLLATHVRSLAPQGKDGALGRKSRAEEHIRRLEGFAAQLQSALRATVADRDAGRAELARTGALEAAQLATEIRTRKAQLNELRDQRARLLANADAQAAAHRQAAFEAQERMRTELNNLQKSIVETRDNAILQDIGIYEYTHPLDDAVAYKDRLTRIKASYKDLARDSEAVSTIQGWIVNGSETEGRKMVAQTSKLMLRAYNAEADNLVHTMKPYKLDSSVSRLSKTRDTIARLGTTMHIEISRKYHKLRLDELRLTADYLAKAAEEKERIRQERAREREEEKAQREFAKQREKLEKERRHLQTALQRLDREADRAAATDLNSKLAAVDKDLDDVVTRQAHLGMGYVYVISNRGAFGANMVKIGMTRRLEPMDRVNELGDASVPFKFDVHALVFSNDAPSLEAKLHKEFAELRVNKVNLRREFFYVTPAQVRTALEKHAGEHLLEYTEESEAYEWHASNGPDRLM